MSDTVAQRAPIETGDVFAGASAMAAACRAFDWSTTLLGVPAGWPPALRSTVALVLQSPVAMSLWCGPSFVLVYNDAYRGVLGSKHPASLGRPGGEVFAELWDVIGADFTAIRLGGAAIALDDVRFELSRGDGSPPAAGWFSYALSPVVDPESSGTDVLAVLSVVTETTARRHAEAALLAERERLRSLIMHMPAPVALHWGAEHRFEMINDAYKAVCGGREVAGLTPREAFPGVEGQGIFELLDGVFASGKSSFTPEAFVRYDRGGGSVEDTWWNLRFEPVRDAQGNVGGILNFMVDVTEQVLARQSTERMLVESRARSDSLATDRARLQQLLDATPAVMAVYSGPQHVVTYMNPEFVRVIGKPNALGRTIREVFPEMIESGIFEELDRVYRTGAPFRVTEIPLPLQREPGAPVEDRVFSFVWMRVPGTFPEGSSGYGGDILVHAVDVTENVRARQDVDAARATAQAAEQRAAFLAEASARLASSLDVESTLQTVADLAVPALADWCFVEVLEQGRVRPASVAHTDPAMVQFAYDVIARYPIDLEAAFGTGKVLRTGEPEFTPVIPDEALVSVAQDDEHLALIRRVGFRSLISVPLQITDGRTIGVLSFVAAESGRTYDEADLAMALEVARRAGAALASAHLYASGQAALGRASALHQVSAAVAGALTEREVAEAVVRYGLPAIGASAGSLVILLPGGQQFEVLAVQGYEDQITRKYQQFPLVAGRPLSDAVLTGRPTYISSVADADAQFPGRSASLRATGFEAFAGLPISAGERCTGALAFSFAEPRVFDMEERAFLETLAAQAGQAFERARLFQAERDARAASEAANRAKTDFLSTMSHELRTPLHAIGGYAELLEMGVRGPVNDAQVTDLSRIRRAGQHLQSLINDILNFARLEAGHVEFEMREVAIADVVADVEALILPQMRARSLVYHAGARTADGTGTDGVSTAATRVLADPEKLRQVILNLLTNAIKFTEPGGSVTLDWDAATQAGVEGGPDAATVRLRVTDTGRGVAASQVDRIFDPFVQVDRELSGASQQGVGLGLSISRNLARGMGGDLTVASTVGEGSTFTLLMRGV
ncbi:MAG: GAF domain-containing protein [Gemmatimonadota bacterium]